MKWLEHLKSSVFSPAEKESLSAKPSKSGDKLLSRSDVLGSNDVHRLRLLAVRKFAICPPWSEVFHCHWPEAFSHRNFHSSNTDEGSLAQGHVSVGAVDIVQHGKTSTKNGSRRRLKGTPLP
jgi:hypothetical protein